MSSSSSSNSDSVESMSIAQLKAELTTRNVDFSKLVEKSELRQLLVEARKNTKTDRTRIYTSVSDDNRIELEDNADEDNEKLRENLQQLGEEGVPYAVIQGEMPENFSAPDMLMYTAISNRGRVLGKEAQSALQWALGGPGVIPCGPLEDAILSKPDDAEDLKLAEKRPKQFEIVARKVESLLRLEQRKIVSWFVIKLGFNIFVTTANQMWMKKADGPSHLPPQCKPCSKERQHLMVQAADVMRRTVT